MMSSHGQSHHPESSRTPQFLVPPQQGSRPHQTSYGYVDSQGFSSYGPRPMFVTAGYQGQTFPSIPRQFRSNYSPHQPSLQSISDISSQYSSSDRSGRYMIQIPAQESQQHLPRPQSAPSQMGDSSSGQLENSGVPSASNVQRMDNYQWVAEPQPPPQPRVPDVFKLNWSSETDITSFEYNGPFSLQVIEGMIRVKENVSQRRNQEQGQNTSMSQSTTESTVNSSGQQSTLPPPSNTSSTEPSGTTVEQPVSE